MGHYQYAATRRAFEYLQSLAELEDQVELDAEREPLMQDPTKAKAADLYAIGVRQWFIEHKDTFDRDPKVRRYRARYQ